MALENVVLTDSATGSRAQILARFGFNCYEFLANVNGREVDVLWAAENFANGEERPSGSGIPLLFPFPGRLRGTTFRWGGQEFQLPEGDGRGNAIHGFVMSRPWRVIEQNGSRVVGQFQASVDDSTILSQWPADFRITATYELTGTQLRSAFRIENPDEKPLPCGFGTHPYFRLPLGSATAADCVVKLPVTRHWDLVDMLPTGRCDDLADPDAYLGGMTFGEMTFDDVFGGLIFKADRCSAEIHDPGSGLTMAIEFDRAFRESVVYTPPHREAICIEPYTCVPGAFDLKESGAHYGVRVLAPGESFTAEVIMSVN
jgi:aldose 1-epimerase